MKTTLRVALCALLIGGCGFFSKTGRMGDLEAKADDLSGRVKILEDRLLAVEKQRIQEHQALKEMDERIRDMETNFQKLQYGQSVSH